MNNYSLTGIPVVENKNKYYGYVSLKELSREIINGDYHKIDTSYSNLLNILNGKEILKYEKEISGKVLVASYAKETFMKKIILDNSYILVVGDRREIIEYAIESKVKLIINIAGVELTKKIKSISYQHH